jgi:hypothetical protein
MNEKTLSLWQGFCFSVYGRLKSALLAFLAFHILFICWWKGVKSGG